MKKLWEVTYVKMPMNVTQKQRVEAETIEQAKELLSFGLNFLYTQKGNNYGVTEFTILDCVEVA